MTGRLTTTILASSLLALALTGCGGSSSSSRSGGGGGGDNGGGESSFTDTASWSFDLPAANDEICFDFNANAPTSDCTGNSWDLRVLTDSRGLTATFWTNGGVTNADGNGGAFSGPFDYSWAELQSWVSGLTDGEGNTIPASLYVADSTSGVFAGDNAIQSNVLEYGIGGGHLLYPNYRVFLITTDSSDATAVSTDDTQVFALQLIDYYGGSSGTASGHPTIRWIERTDGSSPRTATIDASHQTNWVHFDLVHGAIVDTPTADNWHIAFNRYNIKLNGGNSGDGSVAGFIGKTPAGFYTEEGSPIDAAFLSATPADTLADLTAGDIATPVNAGAWEEDEDQSRLNPSYQGTHPNPLDYGWYTYYSMPNAAFPGSPGHIIQANPENGALIRSGSGDSYARFRLSDITYADPADRSSQQTWTVEFEVQPAN